MCAHGVRHIQHEAVHMRRASAQYGGQCGCRLRCLVLDCGGSTGRLPLELQEDGWGHNTWYCSDSTFLLALCHDLMFP